MDVDSFTKKSHVLSMNFRLPKFNNELFNPKNIDFSVVTKPKLINKSLKRASGFTRALVILEIAFLIASLITTFFGVYLVATKDSADPNSEVNEAVVMNFSHFNPIFTPKNSVEDRITKMLYAPLYYIEYEDVNSLGKPNIITKSLVDNYTWSPEMPAQKIKFKLKNNLIFSDNTKITSNDVKFTFDKIKELPTSNQKMKKSFEDLSMTVLNDLEYEVTATKPRFSMIYDLAFAPISKTYNESVPINNLYDSEQSKTPKVTSGTFKLSKRDVQDKDHSDSKIVSNPIKSIESILLLRLDRFTSNNSKTNSAVNNWNIKKYDQVLAKNLIAPKISIETDSKNGKVDLFIRQYAENAGNLEKPEDLKKSLISTTKQEIVNSNWFLTGYFNGKPDVNRSKPTVKIPFRNYVQCLLVSNLSSSYYYSDIDNAKKFHPLELQTKINQNCTEGLDTNLFKLNEEGFYSFNNADPNLSFNILFVGYDKELENNIISNLQTKNKIRTNITSLLNKEEITNAFSNVDKLNSYDLILYPTQITDLKLNAELLAGSKNLIGTTEDQPRIEELNNNYLSKSMAEEDTKALAKFFTEKSLLVNLYNYKTEINHNFRKPIIISKNGEINYEFNSWYTKTVKDWFFR